MYAKQNHYNTKRKHHHGLRQFKMDEDGFTKARPAANPDLIESEDEEVGKLYDSQGEEIRDDNVDSDAVSRYSNDPNYNNLYEMLCIHNEASPYDIEESFKRQALKHHPDAGGDIKKVLPHTI